MFQLSRAAGIAPAILLRFALAAPFLLAPGSGQAARPLVTDDAAVVPYRACQLEAWAERPRAGTTLWLNTGCNPLGETELGLGLGWSELERSGWFGLRRFQVKHLFLAVEERRPGLALAFGSEWAPDAGWRDRHLNLIATAARAGEEERLHFNLGVLARHGPRERRRSLTWAVAFERAFGASRIALETFGADGERSSWQLGFAYEPWPGRLQLDASLGSEIGRFRTSRAFTLGIVLQRADLLP